MMENQVGVDGGAVPLLTLREATVVKGGRRILDRLSLEIVAGQHTAILGPNGSGKSSLINLVTRDLYPLAREIGEPSVTILGRDRWDVFELRSLLGIVSSDLHQAFVGEGAVTGLEVVLSGFFASRGLGRHHAITRAMRERTHEALALLEATALGPKPMAEMSTGEARRVLIARALVPEPHALLLDEPTAGLDLIARRRFLETVRQIARRGKTVILVTHHVEEVLPEIERVVLLKEGRVFRDGPKEAVLTSENLSELFGTRVELRRNGLYSVGEVADSVIAPLPPAP